MKLEINVRIVFDIASKAVIVITKETEHKMRREDLEWLKKNNNWIELD